MKRFVCYTLEGLLRQDGHEVWVVLGIHPSAEQAEAAGRAAATRSGIGQTRIMPYYRTIELPASRDGSALPRRPHVAAQPAAADEQVTVA